MNKTVTEEDCIIAIKAIFRKPPKIKSKIIETNYERKEV